MAEESNDFSIREDGPCGIAPKIRYQWAIRRWPLFLWLTKVPFGEFGTFPEDGGRGEDGLRELPRERNE